MRAQEMTKLLTVALLALAGCSSTPATPCRLDSRRAGERISRFAHDVANLPSYLADHVSYRTWRMGTTVSLLAQQTGRDAEATAHNFGPGLGNLLSEEAGRVQNINSWIDRRAQEEQQNAHCFFERAWFHLQLLE